MLSNIERSKVGKLVSDLPMQDIFHARDVLEMLKSPTRTKKRLKSVKKKETQTEAKHESGKEISQKLLLASYD